MLLASRVKVYSHWAHGLVVVGGRFLVRAFLCYHSPVLAFSLLGTGIVGCRLSARPQQIHIALYHNTWPTTRRHYAGGNHMNINARSAGPPSCFLLASRSPVSCNSEKARFSDAPHAPASRRPRCRCRSRWPRASVPHSVLQEPFGRASRVGAPRASSDAPIGPP